MALSALVVAAGCAGPASQAPPSGRATGTDGASRAGDCLANAASATPQPAVGRGVAGALPDGLSLACLDGTGSVALSGLRGPAVINLWASWCSPCKQELPAVQRFSVAAHGQVAVFAVDTKDDQDAAAKTARSLGLTMPLLADPDGRLLAASGRNALPATLLVNGAGTVAYVYNGPILDLPALANLVRTHLGMTVATG